MPTVIHHGCCKGADAEFQLAVIRGRIGVSNARQWAKNIAHPSDLPGTTEENALALADEFYEAKPPLERNKDIVDACDLLVACPHGPEENRSGTWITVRYARRRKKRIVIVWPTGEVSEETPK